jgi:hypothetical protein
MSYICSGNDGSTLPVICHCQLVPGLGRQIPLIAGVETIGDGGDGNDALVEFGVACGFVGKTTGFCREDEHPLARKASEAKMNENRLMVT